MALSFASVNGFQVLLPTETRPHAIVTGSLPLRFAAPTDTACREFRSTDREDQLAQFDRKDATRTPFAAISWESAAGFNNASLGDAKMRSRNARKAYIEIPQIVKERQR